MIDVNRQIDYMAPTVLLEYTNQKQKKKSSQDLSFAMGKLQKLCSGSVLDYQHGLEVMLESECFASSTRAEPRESTSPKRKKCMTLNVDRCNGFNVPLQVICLSKMSGFQRKELKTRLKSELEQTQVFQEKLNLRSVLNVGVTMSSSINENEKKSDPTVRSGSRMKRGISGKFESSKTAERPVSANNSNLVMKQCQTLLKLLMSHKYGWVFNKPVDPKKLNIPDYYTVIKQPMDLGTIKKKITSGAYSSPWGFVADIRLTFTNAMTYNPPANDVHIMADTLSKFFETRWKPIEKDLASADAHARKETQAPKPVSSSKKRKMSLNDSNNLVPESIMPKMTDEDKQSLTRRLESLLADLPDHIIDFLRRNSGNMNQSSEEIEIDIETLGEDTLFELQKLLDNYLQERETRQVKVKQCKGEVNENGVRTSATYSCKGNDFADEDVDICGDDPPMSSYPTLTIEKDAKARNIKCSSSSSSSSDSGSTGDSDSSTGSEPEEQVSVPNDAAKENSGTKASSDQEKSDVMNPLDANRSWSGLSQSDKDAHPRSLLVEADECQEGEHAPSERQVSPQKLYRAALLRSRFADTILKAREKTLDQVRVTRGTLKNYGVRERKLNDTIGKREHGFKRKLKLLRMLADKLKQKLQLKLSAKESSREQQHVRLCSRQVSVLVADVEKTVDINEDCRILKDLEMLRTAPAEETPMSLDEKCSDYYLNGIGGFKLGGNPLEQLGLFMKVDDEEEEEGEPKAAANKLSARSKPSKSILIDSLLLFGPAIAASYGCLIHEISAAPIASLRRQNQAAAEGSPPLPSSYGWEAC
ncbi:bromodomain domain containing protein [Musa troglodytarum]|uniref:Bromodomain domain containing protein n=1 Tax=Musa troglodytarum TaxID=320322 RepID=A0A9E7LB82_9LILI|nr:bromodomain domain containing protein [Musa troglodytarum]